MSFWHPALLPLPRRWIKYSIFLLNLAMWSFTNLLIPPPAILRASPAASPKELTRRCRVKQWKEGGWWNRDASTGGSHTQQVESMDSPWIWDWLVFFFARLPLEKGQMLRRSWWTTLGTTTVWTNMYMIELSYYVWCDVIWQWYDKVWYDKRM